MSLQENALGAVSRERLLRNAWSLVEVPSPTGDAGGACDRMAEILKSEGFEVERPDGGHPASPAVVARYDSGRPGPTLQFNGHLDVVHLPYCPPAITDDDLFLGSGSCDMKGGTAAALEAMLAIRDANALEAGSILFTAHDLHEAPWGDGHQLDNLIRAGVVGDAVLLPEPLHGQLPVVGRGSFTWKATVRREGPPVHEVMRPLDEPSVIAAAARLVLRLNELAEDLKTRGSDPLAGHASVFIGQVHSGEIFNQYPQIAWLEGTRRWLPGTKQADVEVELRALVAGVATETGTTIDLVITPIRDAFHLNQAHPFVGHFLDAYREVAGSDLPIGPKPFVDDGNSFWALRDIPAITHGPRAGGQHTVNEWVSIDDLERVARTYVLTALKFCR